MLQAPKARLESLSILWQILKWKICILTYVAFNQMKVLFPELSPGL